MSKQVIKRIATRDMKEIKDMNLEELGIYIEFNEENILQAKAIIIGPEGTPYENGILFFNITFPPNYPYSPPKVQYYSSSRYRIHPNLYVGRSHDNFLGKVCLSILNTWSGPKWTSVMHLGSVIVSIQSLLNNNPLHNEPGFEKENGLRNDTYNRIVEYDTYRNLILKNCFDIPSDYEIFRDRINGHLLKQKDNILSKIKDLSETNPNKIKTSLNIYNLNLIIDYPGTEKQMHNKINLI